MSSGQPDHEEVSPSITSGRTLDEPELRRLFAAITHLFYNTNVPLGVIERELVPRLSPDVEFVDPWVHGRGHRIVRNGLRGFHCLFRFDFTIFQVDVQPTSDGRGRALVDGVMNLRNLPVYTYPLRTVLVYDFRFTRGGRDVEITRIDEMWSFGDMLANVPVAGRLYDAGRYAWAALFTVMFKLGCDVVTKLRPSILSSRMPSGARPNR